MSADEIVRRLREEYPPHDLSLITAAADEIERLRDALRYIAYGNGGMSAETARSEAAVALSGETP